MRGEGEEHKGDGNRCEAEHQMICLIVHISSRCGIMLYQVCIITWEQQIHDY